MATTMDGLAGSIESLKGDFTKLQSIVQKYKSINERELAGVITLTTIRPEWDSVAIASVLKEQQPKISWDKVLNELDSAFSTSSSTNSMEISFKSMENVVSLFKFLVEFDRELVKKFLSHSWKRQSSNISLAKSAADAAISRNFPLDKYTTSVVNESTIAPEDKAFWNVNIASNPFNSKELVQALLKQAAAEQQHQEKPVASYLLELPQVARMFLLIGSESEKSRDAKLNGQLWLKLFELLVVQPTELGPFMFKQLVKLDKQHLMNSVIDCFESDPVLVNNILVLAHQAGILPDLLAVKKQFNFKLDLASLADKRNAFSFDEYLRKDVSSHGKEFIVALLDYLEIHASQEYTQSEGGNPPPGLNLRSVAASLRFLASVDIPGDRVDQLRTIEIQCLQLYPRLINFGQGHDAAILANGESNNFSEAVENEMKMYYQKMYARQMEIRDIITMLQRLKQSDIPSEQDVFACMVHSLFDEYRFFPEYPLSALATTAVLFGSLVYFQLIQGIPLSIALRYILDSVKNPPDSNMFKFGLQALIEFRERLNELPKYCKLLLDIPALRGHSQFYQQVQEIVDSTSGESNSANASGSQNNNSAFMPQRGSTPAAGGRPGGSSTVTSGPPPGMLNPVNNSFKTIAAEVSMNETPQEDPSETIADKVLFIVNNIASNNVTSKTNELGGCLDQKYYRWFASYIVGQRSKQEPNYHSLYITMITLLGSKLLEAHITEVTYMHIMQLLNSSDIVSASDKRTQLKNLGQWLGSLHLSRDKPILHKNLYFKGLLKEGYTQEKLAAVLPFVCKTLEKAASSTVFLPPNPWLMGIMQVLAELYEYADLKLNLKFEIEVLCNSLKLDLKSLERADFIRTQQPEIPALPDLTSEMEQMRISSDAVQQLQQQQQQQVVAAAAAAQQVAAQNPTGGASTATSDDPVQLVGNTVFVGHPALKRMFVAAIDKTIRDILAPVLERSVSIATVATKELLTKDFALEPDEGKMRMAAQNLSGVLAANLAMVSSKEMISESLMSHLRTLVTGSGYGDHPLMEQIPVAVSENLDMIIAIIEKATMEKAQAEIDEVLSAQYHVRAHHRETRPGQIFADPHAPAKYPMQLPEPFMLNPGGLLPQQMAIYENFGRVKLTDSLPAGASSTGGANVGSPEEIEAQPQALDATIMQMQQGIEAIDKAVDGSSETSLQQLTSDHRVIVLMNQLLTLAGRSPNPGREQIILKTSQITVSALFTSTKSQLGREVLCFLLDKLCEMSAATAKEVVMWLIYSDDERKYDVQVIITLIRAKLITACEIDVSLAKQIMNKNASANSFAAGLIREAVLGEQPCALRTEFTGCLEAMESLVKSENNSVCQSLLETLENTQSKNEESMPIREQMAYIFAEWLRLVQHPSKTERSLHIFVYRLSSKGILTNADYLSRLIRYSLEAAVSAALNVQGGNQSDAFVAIDALARLIVTIIRTSDAPVKQRVQYTQRILSVISLVFAREHDTKLEQFNGRPYFRLFSTILYEITSREDNFDDFFQQVYLLIANCFQSLQPMAFPSFSFAWMTLISHRLFLPKMMRIEGKKGQKMLARLLESLIRFIGEYSDGKVFPEMIVAMYKGLLRIFLVILYDFPSFLIENHYNLCAVIPQSYVQFKNVILSAFPPNTDLPDPLTFGLKVDKLPEIKQAPVLAVNPGDDLQSFGLKKLVDQYLQTPNLALVKALVPGLKLKQPKKYAGIGFDEITVNVQAISALVLYIATTLTNDGHISNGEVLFNKDSPHMQILTHLMVELNTEGRFFLCEAMVDQLRYPNCHTYFYSCAILSLFKQDISDRKLDVQQLVTRVLLERIICNRPHPWGLIITFTELLKNQSYGFWDLPITKFSPEIERMFASLYEHLSNNGRASEESIDGVSGAPEGRIPSS